MRCRKRPVLAPRRGLSCDARRRQFEAAINNSMQGAGSGMPSALLARQHAACDALEVVVTRCVVCADAKAWFIDATHRPGRRRSAAIVVGSVAKRRDLESLITSAVALRKASGTSHATATPVAAPGSETVAMWLLTGSRMSRARDRLDHPARPAKYRQCQPMGGPRAAGREAVRGHAPLPQPGRAPPNSSTIGPNIAGGIAAAPKCGRSRANIGQQPCNFAQGRPESLDIGATRNRICHGSLPRYWSNLAPLGAPRRIRTPHPRD